MKLTSVGSIASAEATAHSGRLTDTAITVYEEGIPAKYVRISLIAFQNLSLLVI